MKTVLCHWCHKETNDIDAIICGSTVVYDQEVYMYWCCYCDQKDSVVPTGIESEAEEMDNIHPDMDMIEREIILTIIDDALKSNYVISVNDGIENVVEKSSNKEEIFSAMYSTGQDYLFFYKDGKRVGWIWLIYGNGADVVSNCLDNDAMTNLLKNVDTLVEKYSED